MQPRSYIFLSSFYLSYFSMVFFCLVCILFPSLPFCFVIVVLSRSEHHANVGEQPVTGQTREMSAICIQGHAALLVMKVCVCIYNFFCVRVCVCVHACVCVCVCVLQAAVVCGYM